MAVLSNGDYIHAEMLGNCRFGAQQLSLEGVPGFVKESAPRRLCCWADKGQGLDVELIIPVLDMQRLGL